MRTCVQIFLRYCIIQYASRTHINTGARVLLVLTLHVTCTTVQCDSQHFSIQVILTRTIACVVFKVTIICNRSVMTHFVLLKTSFMHYLPVQLYTLSMVRVRNNARSIGYVLLLTTPFLNNINIIKTKQKLSLTGYTLLQYTILQQPPPVEHYYHTVIQYFLALTVQYVLLLPRQYTFGFTEF